MSSIAQDIKEIDVVSFREGIGQWPAGTTGAVVIDLGDDKMVEIANDRGETLDLPIVSAEKLRLVEKYSR